MNDTEPTAVRVMLVDDQHQRAQLVEQALKDAGFQVVAVIRSASGLLYQIAQQRPDVVLIDLQSPGRDVLESLAVVNHHSPTAMVMFGQEEDPDYIREAVAAGISTYLTEDINPARVRPLIQVAMAQFRVYQGLREELQSTRNKLQESQLIHKAKQLLMARKGINEDQAHQMLTRLAMNNNQRLVTVATTVVETLSHDEDES